MATQTQVRAVLDEIPPRLRPTIRSWAPGEIIAERVTLTIAKTAVPGIYTLTTGLYDPASGRAWLPVQDAADQLLPD